MSGTSTSRALTLPSLGAALGGAAATLRRFPTVLIAAAVSSAAAICAAEDLGPQAVQLRLLASAALGLPLLMALTVAGETRPRGARIGLLAGGVLVLAAFYLAWPGWTPDGRGLHFTQLLVAFALAAVVLPFARAPLQHAFWQYNRALLMRAVIAGISALTVYAGLALALVAADKLFGVDVPSEGYFRLWAVIGILFTSWFFLGGVPRDLAALEEVRDYPAVLRIFAQYILTPLVAMYLVILTIYLAKVLVLWDWPSGWIGWLVSGVACAGILALLLLYPIAAATDQRWIAAFARDFWLAILPAIVMLWLAIWQRVHQYGLTEPRYFLIVLSLWLAGTALYFRLSRAPRITAIPASLCALAVLSFAGPWGAYGVARASQTARLKGLLEKDGVLAAGRIDTARGRRVAAHDARQINGAIRYLVENHGVRSLAWALPDSVARRLERVDEPGGGVAQEIARAIGVPFAEPGSAAATGERFRLTVQETFAGTSVSGYDVMVPVRRSSDTTVARDTALTARLEPGSNVVRVRHGGRTLADVALDSMVARAWRFPGARSRMRLPQALLRAEGDGAYGRAALVARSVDATASPKGIRIVELQGYVLVRESKR